MKRRIHRALTSVFLCGAVSSSLSGCDLAFTTATHSLVGGYSDFYVVQDYDRIPFYDSVIFTPLQNMAGPKAGTDLVRSVNQAISSELHSRGFRSEGRQPLYLDGFIIHTDDSLLSKDVVVRIRLIDAATWQVLREANVVGKTEGATSIGVAASAVGTGVVKLLDTTTPAGANARSQESGGLPELQGN